MHNNHLRSVLGTFSVSVAAVALPTLTTHAHGLDTELHAIQQQIASVREAQSTLSTSTQQEQETFASLLQHLDSIAADAQQTHAAIEQSEEQIDTISKEIVTLENTVSEQRTHIAHLIATQYKADEQSVLDLLFGYKTFSEFFQHYTQVKEVQNEIHELTLQLGKNIRTLDADRKQLAVERAKLEQHATDLEDQERAAEAEAAFSKSLLVEYQESQTSIENQLLALQRQQLAVEKEIRASINASGSGTQTTPKPSSTETTFIWPVTGRYITCEFMCEDYPFDRDHKGLDIAMPQGSPIYAAASGTVQRVKFDPTSTDLGFIMINHGNDLFTLYLHTSCVIVSYDEYVVQGQEIGCTGGGKGTPGSGSSTGPHLHFEVREGYTAVNPIQYLP